MNNVLFWDFDGTLVHANDAYYLSLSGALEKNGFSLPEVASNVQSSVYDAILEQTGLTASQINVVIREMEELDSGGEVPEEEPGKKDC